MKTLKLTTYILLSLFFVTTSCKKEGCTDEHALNYNEDAKKDDGSCNYATENEVKLKFEHKWGNTWADFKMNETFTHPGTGETMNFQTLNYYISNVKLKREDGSWWSETESYHLVKASENEVPELKLLAPNGNYTAISYMIGVDSTRNVSGAQTGALSPSHGMFWSWNTGYIFIKAEGISDDASNGGFSYHIGGFQGQNNAIRINEHDFGSEKLVVEKDGHPSVHFHVNAARFWHGGISLQDVHTIHMPGANAVILADNFKEAFIVHNIH